MKPDQNERGSILVIALLVLLMASAVSVLMVSTSTMETRIAANDKKYTAFFYGAEGGISSGTKVLLDTVANRQVGQYPGLLWSEETYTPTNIPGQILDELIGTRTSEAGTGFTYDSPGNEPMVTEVRLKRDPSAFQCPGSSSEFGAGHEGIGYGSSGGIEIHYYIKSRAREPAPSNSNTNVAVEAKYRKVMNVGGGK